ncbi:MAG: hypothetical protein QJR00_07255 [Bacillota bacterium]|nr:hypothetical protein [Bacillota bacterium]
MWQDGALAFVAVLFGTAALWDGFANSAELTILNGLVAAHVLILALVAWSLTRRRHALASKPPREALLLASFLAALAMFFPIWTGQAANEAAGRDNLFLESLMVFFAIWGALQPLEGEKGNPSFPPR